MNFKEFARFMARINDIVERWNRPARKERQRRDMHIDTLDVNVRTHESESKKPEVSNEKTS